MSNEHNQSGRHPHKAEPERLHPKHHDKQQLKQGSSEQRQSQPNGKSRDHSHNGDTFLNEVRRVDSEQ